MANNHHGPPFPFPYPQMQQMQQPPSNAHHDGQQHPPHPPHPQHPQHPPPPPPGWNLPGLHQQYPPPQPYMPQPGHAENQNNLPQFPSAALWPPQIPPEWLQLMQSGMQSGMAPPPMPGLNFPPPSLSQTPQAPTTPMAFPPHFPPRPAAAPLERVQEVTGTDREDREVSDAEGALRTTAAIAVRQRYPEPPRSAPQPMATPSRTGDVYNPEKPSAGQTTSHTSTPKSVQQASAVVNEMDLVQQQREEAKQFIRLLNSNNIGYHALAKENIDIELLRAMYRSMNLPSEPEPIPPPKANGTAAPKSSSQVLESPATASAPSTSQKTIPAVSTNVAAASVASAAASPVDRKDYLARLQAAKLARQSGPAKVSPPHTSPPVTAASSATAISTPQATTTPTRKQPVTDEQKARQTELIKQRLEALKAQSKQSATAPSTQNLAPQQSLTKPPHTPATNVPTQQTSAPGFPGIPGLFMNSAPNSSNGTTTPSRLPQSAPQKRHAPSDTEASTPRGSVTPYNRPFGHSSYVQQEDSMIIEVSDDESNGSDMDIDDDQLSTGPPVIRQAPVSIPGFPPRQAPAPVSQSAVSTPGPQTPATIARTGELNTKEQELAALKLTLKKKLAEQKRIKEAAEAAAAAASTSSHGTLSNQHQAQSSSATPAQKSQSASHARTPVAHATVQADASAVDSSRDKKRRRRTEIQEQLPSLDDEIASNEAEMARLARDLETLKANNERIVRDKERLTNELENLGIDTGGMSHADMRATKNEIERAMSPETDTVPRTASVLSRSILPNGESKAFASASADRVDDMGHAFASRAQPLVGSQANPRYGFLPGIGQAAPQTSAPAVSHPPSHLVQEPARSAPGDLQAGTDVNDLADTAVNAQAPNDRASATPMDDEEDFYSPPPLAEVSVGAEPSVTELPEAQVESSVANAPSPSEEGEVEMSESSEEEEEYEPDESIVDESVLEPPTEQAQPLEPRVIQSQSVGQSQVSTEDEEAYEPPDIEEEMTDVAPATDALQVEASSPGDADDGAMDIATSSSESDDSESDSDGETHSELGESGSETHATQQDTLIADGLAPELQAETVAMTAPVVVQSDEMPVIEEEPEIPRFTPYESPLRMFKSYRYHPNFSQDVDGGFLSMTFSHQIDPETPLCPFESAGGSCNDPECPNQHFRGMGINGEKLLVQLGTANPGKTQDERQQWNNGLRSVLQDLRQKNIKDPNGIAREIANYRRQFLKDETRVVNL
ncbi:uncharacterized protein EKO05_0000044 [Ascochyta rabiei]|uniref:uncharacterized protein n=1 Tax=Didymella rabiei TaxID=5454 RepID=UPI0018FFC530|nr:uncharacterized protein EKO05_0000044 [Ascochyta rabiei]UPX09353.1 hypothetical protein EKO05_0000044 [Ascochyta rabiei]